MRSQVDLALLGLFCVALGAGCAAPPTELPEVHTTYIGVTPAYADQAYSRLEGFSLQDPMRELTLRVLPLEAGLDAARKGEIAFLITAAEPPADWFATPLEQSALLIITSSNPGVPGLTQRELREIYTGQTTDWSQVDGRERPIQPMIYIEGDELRTTFEAVVMSSSRLTPNARLLPDPASMAEAVRSTPGAIGLLPDYASVSDLTVLSLDGYRPSAVNVSNGSYPLLLTWSALAPHEPEGLARAWLVWIQESE